MIVAYFNVRTACDTIIGIMVRFGALVGQKKCDPPGSCGGACHIVSTNT